MFVDTYNTVLAFTHCLAHWQLPMLWQEKIYPSPLWHMRCELMSQLCTLELLPLPLSHRWAVIVFPQKQLIRNHWYNFKVLHATYICQFVKAPPHSVQTIALMSKIKENPLIYLKSCWHLSAAIKNLFAAGLKQKQITLPYVMRFQQAQILAHIVTPTTKPARSQQTNQESRVAHKQAHIHVFATLLA